MSDWIRTMGMKKGAFAAQAKRRHMTPKQFASFVIKHKKTKNSGYNPTMRTYRRALLAHTLSKLSKRKSNQSERRFKGRTRRRTHTRRQR